jgi:hypothetical protein
MHLVETHFQRDECFQHILGDLQEIAILCHLQVSCVV